MKVNTNNCNFLFHFIRFFFTCSTFHLMTAAVGFPYIFNLLVHYPKKFSVTHSYLCNRSIKNYPPKISSTDVPEKKKKFSEKKNSHTTPKSKGAIEIKEKNSFSKLKKSIKSSSNDDNGNDGDK